MRRGTRWALVGAAAGLGWAAWRARRTASYDLRGRVVVITGGSRGLGLILARRFAREGARLVLLARDEAELAQAREHVLAAAAPHRVEVLTIPCELRDRRSAVRAIDEAVARFGRFDVLINNAGQIQVSPLEHLSLRDFEEAMALHVFAPLVTTMAAFPHLKRAPGGARVLNVSSIGGKVAAPHLLPYSTSKFALVGLSDGLRAELRRHGIRVTTVCPGLMRTGSPPHARFKGRHRAEYAWFAISDGSPLVSVNAERAARRIVAACRRGAPALTLGPQAKLASILNELAPGTTAALVALVTRLLPGPSPASGHADWSGFESTSNRAPSFWTRLSDRASVANNELEAIRGSEQHGAAAIHGNVSRRASRPGG